MLLLKYFVIVLLSIIGFIISLGLVTVLAHNKRASGAKLMCLLPPLVANFLMSLARIDIELLFFVLGFWFECLQFLQLDQYIHRAAADDLVQNLVDFPVELRVLVHET